MHTQAYMILQTLHLEVSCLHRIFGIPLNLFHISFGNPKIFRLYLEFSYKIKNRYRIIVSDASLKISPFLGRLFRQWKKLGLELGLVTNNNGQGARFLLWGV
jgi:hypothetical protein